MIRTPSLSRRDWLRLSTAGVVGVSMSGWLEALAQDAAKNPQRKRSCILLWMDGGPTQTDTFDMKPDHPNGGEFKPIATNVTGMQISQHLPKIAKFGDRMAIIRSMQTKEGDHGRATFLMRTGYLPQGPIQYPTLGSLISKELGSDENDLPNFVSIAPQRFLSPQAFGPGFLGPQYAPLVVGQNGFAAPNAPETGLKVQDLDLPSSVTTAENEARVGLLQSLENDFVSTRPGLSTQSHQAAYGRALRLMRSQASKAFNLEDEKKEVRDSYGRNQFGQGCLLARRLVERNVPFVEVTLSNWDTHNDNFNQVKRLSETLDTAWSALMTDLKQRGLLDTTLIVWMGEFGRTPQIQKGRNGRDHFPAAWSTVLAGGGIKGGQVVGKTSPDGMTVADRPVPTTDFLATICLALGIDPMKQNQSNVGRPIRIVDKAANPIKGVVS
jgi:Protein of unknown function (DUF1501)